MLRQTGSTYGLAFQRRTLTLYQGAFMKRSVKLGPGGIGAIYGVKTTGGLPVVIATIPDTGTDPRPATMTAADWERDHASIPAVFTTGLGDLDLSDDDQTLYVTNLNNNSIYSLAVDGTNPVTPGAPLAVPGPGCADWHIFGLGINGTTGLVGGVCAQALTAHVYRFTATGPASGLAASPAFSFPLTYSKGEAISWVATVPDLVGAPWNPWNDDGETGPTAVNVIQPGRVVTTNPQPQITDLLVTDRGDLAIGLRDRFEDQVGHKLIGLDGRTDRLTEGQAGGDLLLACVNATGGWTLEDGGRCGGRNGTGVNNGEGPGTPGGEFFAGDRLPLSHDETALGSLARIPNSGKLIATVYDPNTTPSQEGDAFSQGIIRFSDTNGVATQPLRLEHGWDRNSMGKTNGLGDIELLCGSAPLQIGNRVWYDADADGIQDPDEPGIDGVVVQLAKGTATVASTTTANGGAFYFDQTNVTPASPLRRRTTRFVLATRPDRHSRAPWPECVSRRPKPAPNPVRVRPARPVPPRQSVQSSETPTHSSSARPPSSPCRPPLSHDPA